MNILEMLRDANCDVDGAIRRFHGREDMYTSLMMDFLEDDSLIGYRDAVAANDYDTAFLHVHNIKGLSASFGFTDLNKVSTVISEAFRNKEYAYALSFNNELYSQYYRITELLSACE